MTKHIITLGCALTTTLVVAVIALAQFAGVPVWNAGFEDEPYDTDSVGDGAMEIRTLKEGVRERMEIQHQFGDGVDTGFHKEGSAWALTSADCSAEAIDPDYEPGRLCVQTTDNSVWVLNDALTDYESTDELPTNAIILWDQATGCAGAPLACPCGYTEVTEFRGLMVRGADVAGVDGNIPDTPGTTCIGVADPAECNGGGNVDGMYDDTLEILQMPSHNHETDQWEGSVGTWWFDSADRDHVSVVRPPIPTSYTGGDDPHYHPLRTVLFCRKDAS